MRLSFVLFSALALSAMAQEKFEVSMKSIPTRGEMLWLGQTVNLSGADALALGKAMPEMNLRDERLRPARLGGPGKVRIVNVLPSLDTPVCDIQTHQLSEAKLGAEVERVTISMDLPYAQARFAQNAKLTNITYLSDFNERDFAQKSGLLIKEKGVLARAVLVLDKNGIVRHLQVVPEILSLPDMPAAFQKSRDLLGKERP